jgi:hypothetical protein
MIGLGCWVTAPCDQGSVWALKKWPPLLFGIRQPSRLDFETATDRSFRLRSRLRASCFWVAQWYGATIRSRKHRSGYCHIGCCQTKHQHDQPDHILHWGFSPCCSCKTPHVCRNLARPTNYIGSCKSLRIETFRVLCFTVHAFLHNACS